MDDNKLVELSIKAQENAYAPYSNITVGAALLGSSGNVYMGCNVENASYGASVCGERTAVFKAVSQGERDFKAIAISSSLDDFIYPCGICRQVLIEFSADMKVIITNRKRDMRIYTVSELFPHSFRLANQQM